MVINQYHSIGDLMFIEPILRHYAKEEQVHLPVADHLYDLAVKMYDIENLVIHKKSQFKLDYDSIDVDNPDYLPLRFANQILRDLKPDDHSDYENMMLDKYELAGLDPELWKELDLQFDLDKSENLFKMLNPDNEDYILINNHSQAGSIDIKLKNTKSKIIYMQEIAGFDVIDWHDVLSNAKSIHTVSTCVLFMLQAMRFNGQCYVYPRPNEDGLRGISQLDFDYTVIRKAKKVGK